MASEGITMIPMSSTGGGGGGAVGRLAGFFAATPGLGFGFELPAAGFCAAVFGFAGVVVWAKQTDVSAHAAIKAAANFTARGKEANMAADSTRAVDLTLAALIMQFGCHPQRARLHWVKVPVS